MPSKYFFILGFINVWYYTAYNERVIQCDTGTIGITLASCFHPRPGGQKDSLGGKVKAITIFIDQK